MKTKKLINRVDELLALGEIARNSRDFDTDSSLDPGKMAEFKAACLSFISQIFGETHSYYSEFESGISDNSWTKEEAERGIGVLRAIRVEIENGWIFSIKKLVTAEVFADFLDMAEHLLENKYKDASAVMIGGVLEEHLRQLCEKNEIDVTVEKGEKMVARKADTLNADLVKKDVYDKLEAKSVTAWLGLRNEAAHGHYDKYDEKQVWDMLSGVLGFIQRNSL